MDNKIKYFLKLSSLLLLAVILLDITSCANTKTQAAEDVKKQWLGLTAYPERVRPMVNTYHMFDSTNTKVGSMVLAFAPEGGRLIGRDTSQFDDGTVYETAEMEINLEKFQQEKLSMDIAAGEYNIDINIAKNSDVLQGKYDIWSGKNLSRTKKIDSVYSYDIFRTELYLLLHTIDLKPGDSVAFNMFVSNSLTVVKAALIYEKSETVRVPAGEFITDVILLKTEGGILDNRIWVSKEAPHKVVKFYLHFTDLDLYLMSSEDQASFLL